MTYKASPINRKLKVRVNHCGVRRINKGKLRSRPLIALTRYQMNSARKIGIKNRLPTTMSVMASAIVISQADTRVIVSGLLGSDNGKEIKEACNYHEPITT